MTSRPGSPLRGDIHWIDFNPSRGPGDAGLRPAVVMSMESFNSLMPVVTVAAITTRITPTYNVTVTLPAGRPLSRECQILTFQVMTVDKARLGGYMGSLDATQLEKLENAMRLTWGLNGGVKDADEHWQKTGLGRQGIAIITAMLGRDLSAGHAFVSYVREDALRVDQLQQKLQAAGIPVWRDTADLWPGEDWRAEIRRAISDNALVFVACFSRASLARGKTYKNEELALAIEQIRLRRPEDPWLIPVRFDDCEIPNWDIGSGRILTSIQHVDLFEDRFNDGTNRLIAAVMRIFGRQTDAATPGMGQNAASVEGKD
jgi:mRNA-degrading endonuclease toxin of MazEF toxin-antitoxin module